MTEMFLCSGQIHVLNALKTKFDTTPPYIGLMSNSDIISKTYQIPVELSECSYSNYARQPCSGWLVTSGSNPYISGPRVSFTVSGVALINGYFVASAGVSGYALWAEGFPITDQGTKASGVVINVIPKLALKYYTET